jgi:hypothetical protein
VKNCAKCSHFDTSYFARSRIIDTYYLSKLWYVSLLIDIPQNIIKEIEKASSSFIWNNSQRAAVSMKKVKLCVEKGGLNHTDIRSKIEAMSLMLLLRQSSKTPTDELFDYFYEKVRNISKTRLTRLAVPHLYKNIRKAEINCKLTYLNDNAFNINGKNFQNERISTKLLYKSIMDNHPNDNIVNYWSTKLNFPEPQLEKFLKLSVCKFIDGASRNVHYGIIHKFLNTRARQSYIANADPECKFCLSENMHFREDITHCFISCSKVVNFWPRIERIIGKVVPGIILTDVNKIFGFLTNPDSKKLQTLVNLIIQVAQKSIWYSRLLYERKTTLKPPWENFKVYFLRTILKLHEILEEKVFTSFFLKNGIIKMSRKKSIVDFIA